MYTIYVYCLQFFFLQDFFFRFHFPRSYSRVLPDNILAWMEAFSTSYGLLPAENYMGWGLVREQKLGLKQARESSLAISVPNFDSQQSITLEFNLLLQEAWVGGTDLSNLDEPRPGGRLGIGNGVASTSVKDVAGPKFGYQAKE